MIWSEHLAVRVRILKRDLLGFYESRLFARIKQETSNMIV